jgi:hypothetical protein
MPRRMSWLMVGSARADEQRPVSQEQRSLTDETPGALEVRHGRDVLARNIDGGARLPQFRLESDEVGAASREGVVWPAVDHCFRGAHECQ